MQFFPATSKDLAVPSPNTPHSPDISASNPAMPPTDDKTLPDFETAHQLHLHLLRHDRSRMINEDSPTFYRKLPHWMDICNADAGIQITVVSDRAEFLMDRIVLGRIMTLVRDAVRFGGECCESHLVLLERGQY
jgi:hypothetical protein